MGRRFWGALWGVILVSGFSLEAKPCLPYVKLLTEHKQKSIIEKLESEEASEVLKGLDRINHVMNGDVSVAPAERPKDFSPNEEIKILLDGVIPHLFALIKNDQLSAFVKVDGKTLHELFAAERQPSEQGKILAHSVQTLFQFRAIIQAWGSNTPPQWVEDFNTGTAALPADLRGLENLLPLDARHQMSWSEFVFALLQEKLFEDLAEVESILPLSNYELLSISLAAYSKTQPELPESLAELAEKVDTQMSDAALHLHSLRRLTQKLETLDEEAKRQAHPYFHLHPEMELIAHSMIRAHHSLEAVRSLKRFNDIDVYDLLLPIKSRLNEAQLEELERRAEELQTQMFKDLMTLRNLLVQERAPEEAEVWEMIGRIPLDHRYLVWKMLRFAVTDEAQAALTGTL